MKKNKKGMDYNLNNLENTSCNSCEVDVDMDKSLIDSLVGEDASVSGDLGQSLNRIANIEAGTDIIGGGGALTQEAAVNSGLGAIGGVTDDVMYHNLAAYTMIDVEDENIQNNQGS